MESKYTARCQEPNTVTSVGRAGLPRACFGDWILPVGSLLDESGLELVPNASWHGRGLGIIDKIQVCGKASGFRAKP